MDAIVKSITYEEVEELKSKGHIVVICGNGNIGMGNGNIGHEFIIATSSEALAIAMHKTIFVPEMKIKIEDLLFDMKDLYEDIPKKNYKKNKFFE